MPRASNRNKRRRSSIGDVKASNFYSSVASQISELSNQRPRELNACSLTHGSSNLTQIRLPREHVLAKRRTMPISEFWEHDPGGWFILLEAGFRAENIIEQVAMYNRVVRCLIGFQIQKVRPQLPHESDPECYSNLRKLLIDTFSVPLRERLRELYNGSCQGLKPSEILRKLRSATNTPISDANEEYLKEMFFHHLPNSITSILSAHVDENCDQLALRADSIFVRNCNTPVANSPNVLLIRIDVTAVINIARTSASFHGLLKMHIRARLQIILVLIHDASTISDLENVLVIADDPVVFLSRIIF